MTDKNSEPDPGVEGTVARPGGVSYLRIPARDVRRSADFYHSVFGWRLRGEPEAPSFSDGTGHVIGHWRTDLPTAGQAGVRPYIYVTDLDATLRTAAGRGAELVTPPYPEGNLWIAVILDPAGNAIGIWQDGPRHPSGSLSIRPPLIKRCPQAEKRNTDMKRGRRRCRSRSSGCT
jgi:predicted enzyme related to lactoylglutathione lyase